MSYRGIAKGTIIELENPLPYDQGQRLSISIEALQNEPTTSIDAILRVMREPPHLEAAAVGELERAIEEGNIPVQQEGSFDIKGGLEKSR